MSLITLPLTAGCSASSHKHNSKSCHHGRPVSAHHVIERLAHVMNHVAFSTASLTCMMSLKSNCDPPLSESPSHIQARYFDGFNL